MKKENKKVVTNFNAPKQVDDLTSAVPKLMILHTKYKIQNTKYIFVFMALSLVLSLIFASKVEAATTISRPVNNLGLVGYWDFNTGKGTDIAWDRSGNGNNGKLTTMDPATDWINSKTGLGTALDFDGSDDVVNAGASTTLDLNGKNFTLSLWVYIRSATGSNRFFDKRGASGPGWNFALNNAGADLNFFDGSNHLSSANAWSANRWIHVAVTYDGTNLRFYSDGVPWGSVAYSGAPASSQDFYIGRRHDGQRQLDGKMDEARVYNRALSTDEIKRLYLATQPKISSIPISNGLVGYWDFNTGDGTDIAWDRSGNGYNGQLANMDPATDWVDGKSGNGMALDLDGTNDVIKCTDSACGGTGANQLDLGTKDMTFSAWIYTTKTGQQFFISKDDDQDTSGYSLSLNASNLLMATFEINGVSYSTYSAPDGPTIQPNTWTHVVFVVRRSSVVKRYVNGVNVGADLDISAGSATSENNAYDFCVGVRDDNLGCGVVANLPFQGKIDELRVYNRALSADEIKRLYNLNQPKTSAVQLDKGLVGYWDFNFGDGSSIAWDVSRNGNNGRLTNMQVNSDWVDSKNSKLGQALDFDGTDDYIDLGSPTSLDNLSSGPVSYSVWVYFNSLSGAKAIISPTNGSSQAVNGISLNTPGTPNRWAFRRECVTQDLQVETASGTTVANQWQHIVAIWDGSVTASNVRIYLDGVEQAHTAANLSCTGGFTTDNTASVSIGRDNFPSSYLGGRLDDIRIYNRALTTDEVQRLYLMGK